MTNTSKQKVKECITLLEKVTGKKVILRENEESIDYVDVLIDFRKVTSDLLNGEYKGYIENLATVFETAGNEVNHNEHYNNFTNLESKLVNAFIDKVSFALKNKLYSMGYK